MNELQPVRGSGQVRLNELRRVAREVHRLSNVTSQYPVQIVGSASGMHFRLADDFEFPAQLRTMVTTPEGVRKYGWVEVYTDDDGVVQDVVGGRYGFDDEPLYAVHVTNGLVALDTVVMLSKGKDGGDYMVFDHPGQVAIRVVERDGSPNVYPVDTLITGPGGTVIDHGDGSAEIDFQYAVAQDSAVTAFVDGINVRADNGLAYNGQTFNIGPLVFETMTLLAATPVKSMGGVTNGQQDFGGSKLFPEVLAGGLAAGSIVTHSIFVGENLDDNLDYGTRTPPENVLGLLINFDHTDTPRPEAVFSIARNLSRSPLCWMESSLAWFAGLGARTALGDRPGLTTNFEIVTHTHSDPINPWRQQVYVHKFEFTCGLLTRYTVESYSDDQGDGIEL